MERLRQRILVAKDALNRFNEIMCLTNHSTIEKDAAIQRFEFTFEAVWKAAKEFLYEIEGIDIGSPKGVFRACREVGLLDQAQTSLSLQMVDDRNMTSHTYNKALAEKIFTRLPEYLELMKICIKKMEDRMQ